MDSQFMDAGTYAWIVIIIFFLIFSTLQIRNCVRNVRGINNNFAEMYPNAAGASCGQTNQSSVYTIDVHNSAPSNFTNPGYVPTENGVKGQSNDGLPTYEEAIATVKNPIESVTPPLPVGQTVNERSQNVSSSRGRQHRHRRHRHHRHHNSEHQNANSQPDAPEEHSRRHRHHRGFRLKRHLAKINRRNHTDNDK